MCLVGCMWQEDLVGCVGGDEFVIILFCFDDCYDCVIVVVWYVFDSISWVFQIDVFELFILFLIGIIFYLDYGIDIDGLIYIGDFVMYQVKYLGCVNY